MAVRKVKKSGVGKARKPAPRRRRRRVSGANDIGGALMKVGGLGAGAIAARELNTILVKFMPSLGTSPMLSAGLQIAFGYFLPKFAKGAFFANMGDGAIANGVMVFVVSTGVISGADNVSSYRIGSAGTSYLRAVNGTGNLKVINGENNRVGNNPPSTKRTFPVYS